MTLKRYLIVTQVQGNTTNLTLGRKWQTKLKNANLIAMFKSHYFTGNYVIEICHFIFKPFFLILVDEDDGCSLDYSDQLSETLSTQSDCVSVTSQKSDSFSSTPDSAGSSGYESITLRPPRHTKLSGSGQNQGSDETHS